MFIMKAPFPAYETTTVLPSPDFGDSEALKATITTMRTMNGDMHTYVIARNGLKKLKWRFKTSRNKVKEVREFIEAYFDEAIHVTDHEGNTWLGYLRNNPYEFEDIARAPNFPGGELSSFTLELEEK